MALWIIRLSLLTLGGMMLVAVISVVRTSVVYRGKQPDESRDRAGEREQKWYPLR
jgi:hypothetical protein